MVLALGLAACGSSGGGSAATTSTTSPHSTSAPTTSAGETSSTSTPTTGAGEMPIYQPSTVISRTSGHTQLTTPDSVEQVTSFYDKALTGWTITSSSKTATSTNIVAKRGNQGVTLAISPQGPSGTSISISMYPV
jgi:hypothetical protein